MTPSAHKGLLWVLELTGLQLTLHLRPFLEEVQKSNAYTTSMTALCPDADAKRASRVSNGADKVSASAT